MQSASPAEPFSPSSRSQAEEVSPAFILSGPFEAFTPITPAGTVPGHEPEVLSPLMLESESPWADSSQALRGKSSGAETATTRADTQASGPADTNDTPLESDATPPHLRPRKEFLADVLAVEGDELESGEAGSSKEAEKLSHKVQQVCCQPCTFLFWVPLVLWLVSTLVLR